MIVVTPVLSGTKTRSISFGFFPVFKNFFSISKVYIRSYYNGLFKNWIRQEIFVKGINYKNASSSHVLPWLSCHDLAMILP